MHPDVICGLDIGASSIRALIMQSLELYAKEDKGSLLPAQEKILGFAAAPTKGFSKGVVTNLSLLSDVIEDVVSKAEAMAHRRVRKLVTNISGVHIRAFRSRGSVHISDRPSEITKEDIDRCVRSAKLIAMSLDREVIHLALEQFYIDDRMKIDDPLGLFGSKLDLDLNIITSLVSTLQNITRAVNLAGCEVEDMVVSGAGTALSVFDDRELEEGALVIDVGKDLTEETLFMHGKLRDCFYFPFGGDDLTMVLQDRMRIMFEEAEELRVRYGIVLKDSRRVYDDGQIPIHGLKNRPGPEKSFTLPDKAIAGGMADPETRDLGSNSSRLGVISKREFSNFLFPKVEEIMGEAYKKIEPFLKERKKLPHISVVGGVSRMDGFVEAVEEIFGVPVSMGRIRNVKDFYDMNFACSLGLARYGARNRTEKGPDRTLCRNSMIGRFITRIQKLVSEYF